MFLLSRKGTDPTETAPPEYDLAMRGISGNLVATSDSIQGWYVLNPVWWEYLSDGQRQAIIAAQNRAWVAIAGREWHMRVTTRPFPAAAWARNVDMMTPNPTDPAAWNRYLATKQGQMRGQSLGDSAAFLGVQIGNRSFVQGMLSRAPWINGGKSITDRERSRVAADLANVTRALDEIARPANQREVEWLTQRSVGLCLPNPTAYRSVGDGPLDAYDISGVYDSVDIEPGPIGSRHMRVIGSEGRTGPEQIDRHVAILSIGRIEAQRIPEARRPWLSHALRFGGVELSIHGQIVPGKEAAADVENQIALILDQKPQYVEHGIQIPPSMERAHSRAVDLQDELIEGTAATADRAYVWVRMAVPGSDAKNVIERAEQLRKAFDRVSIETHFMRNQEGAYREFIPGEPLSTTAHKRRMSAEMWAASIPHLSTSVGDRQGLHVARVAGSSGAPFVWDMHRAMQENQGGFTPVVADMGSGKSYLIGGLAALNTLRGLSGTIFDPSGPLARLCEWEPIKDRSRAISLLDGTPGLLSPFGLIPEPVEGDSEADEKMTLEDRRVVARMRRQALALDVMRGCLPPGLDKHARTEVILGEALRATEGRATSSILDALDHLEVIQRDGDDAHAQALYQHLRGIAEHPYTRLMFHSAGARMSIDDDPTLLVITLSGLVLPNFSSDRSQWETEERLAVPLVNLAAHYAALRVYSRPRSERKLIFLDEAHFLEQWPSGRALLAKLQRDSRKHTVRVFSASQDVATTLTAQKAAKSLSSDVLIGAMDDEDNQRAALQLARVPVKVGYEAGLAGLRPPPNPMNDRVDEDWREWLIRVDGKVARIRPDFRDVEGGTLHDLLNTTSQASKGYVKATVADVDGEWFP